MAIVISSRFDNYVHEYDVFSNHIAKLSGVEKIQLNDGSQDLVDERIEFIQFGADITEIKDYCCYNMEDLTSIVLPSSLKIIGNEAFAYTNVCEVDIPNGIQRIGFAAFNGTSLVSINLPNTLTYIGGCAFAWSQLKSIDIPPSLNTINHWTFIGNNLISVEIPEGITYIAGEAFEDNMITSVSLPNSLSLLEPGVFAGNDLYELSLPSGIVMYEQVFAYNKNLSSVQIPSNVKIWRGNPFCGCPYLSSLKEVKINLSESQYLKNGKIGLVNTSNMLVIPLDELPNENVMPVNSIGQYCYSYSDISQINLDDPNLSGISKYAFFQAQNLTSVSFGQNNIKQIGDNAFNQCDLRELTLPSSITNIELRTFAFNKNLISVDIPTSISSIGDGAFYECTGLRDVYMTGDYEIAPHIEENAFENTGVEGTGCLIHVKNKTMYDLFNSAGLLALSSIGGITYN